MDSRLRWAALMGAVLATGCIGFTLRTAPGPAREVPATLYGAGPGEVALSELVAAGWTLAEESRDEQVFILATPTGGVREAEARVRMTRLPPVVEYVRLRYSMGRLSTYERLLEDLIARHGRPQRSEEVHEFELFALDPHSERPRPARFVVHRWQGAEADLVLVGGLEVIGNLQAAMDYQLLLVPTQGAP